MFSCDLCEFVCGKEGFLKMHVQRIHEKKFICSGSAAKCDFVGRKKKELDEHLKICHKEELSTCSLCNYASVRKAVLRSHIERVHKQMKKFRCAKCNYKSYEKRDLTFHENSFHKKKFNIKCKLCRFSCLSFARLRSHKKTHLPILHCALCHYQCKYWSFLQKHITKVHNVELDTIVLVRRIQEKNLKCSMCDFVASEEKEMNTHLQVNHKEKIYNCPLCNYFSIDIQEVKCHVERIHEARQ